MNDFLKEVALELEMRDAGGSRFKSRLNKRLESQMESVTDHGKDLMQVCFPPMLEAIKEHTKNAVEGTPGTGRPVLSALVLSNIEPEVVVAISLKCVLNCLTRSKSFTETAISIGNSIEDETRLRAFEEENPYLFNVVLKDLTERSSGYMYKRRKLLESAKRDGIDWANWETSTKTHIGVYLLGVIIDQTGLVRKTTQKKRNKKKDLLVATEETQKFIQDRNLNLEFLTPEYYPMLVKPKAWTSPVSGGYWTKHIPQLPLVKTKNQRLIEELKNIDMPAVYEGLNALQNTAYKINNKMLDFLLHVWDNGLQVMGLPPSEDLPIPPKPHDIATNLEAKIAWKRKAVIVHTENNRMNSKRLLLRKTLLIAEKFKDESEIYFPHQLDFRGRAYCVPSYLNVQGADFCKALLLFSKGKPIGEQGACWLAVHLANCYGMDKVSMQDRINWVQEHEEIILQCAKDPFENRWWEEADKPFQTLAAIFEWEQFILKGVDYKCALPIAMDATANGIQHFSAMLRSKTTGQLCNLVPADKPQDIYQHVANMVIKKLEKSEEPLAKLWLQYGITRQLLKRPVMVLGYGGKQYGFTDFVMDEIQSRMDKGKPHPFQDRLRASSFLAKIIWQSISTVVHACTDVMAWLQDGARLASKENLPLVWFTPTGFPVTQSYNEFKSTQVRTKLQGVLYQPRISKETNKIDKNRCVNACSPNFVHSLDASHMFLTIVTALKHDVTHFAFVHDSYATHASDTEMLNVCIRVCFVEMYKQNDVLDNFYQEIIKLLPPKKRAKFKAPPEKGDLDIEEVMKSDFFFS